MHLIRPSVIAAIIGGEFRLNLKRVAPYVMCALFCLNAVVWWSSRPGQGLTSNGDFAIAGLFAVFSFFTAPFFTALMLGEPIVRDIRLQIIPLILSKPINRTEYVLGKFLGNYLVMMSCYSVYGLTLVALQWTRTESMTVLPWRTLPYIKHFVVFLAITQFTMGACWFMIGSLTRSVRLVYALVTSFYFLYPAVSIFTGNFLPRWRVELDVVGMSWLELARVGRTIDEINRITLVYDWVFLSNRILILLVGVLFLIVTVMRLRVDHEAERKPERSLGLLLAPERLSLEVAAGVNDSIVFERDLNAVELPVVNAESRGFLNHTRQFIAAAKSELRFLLIERSLFIVAPLIVLLSCLELQPFSATAIPQPAVYATNSTRALTLLLFGVILFYAGEAMHREKECRTHSIIWPLPPPNWVFLLAKFASVLALCIALIGLTGVSAIGLQVYRGADRLGVVSYASIYSVILIPTILCCIALTMMTHSLLRRKYVAHVINLAIGGSLIVLLTQNHVGALYNPSLYRLWSYAESSGFSLDFGLLMMHRVYLLSITAFALSIAHLLYERKLTRRRTANRVSMAASIGSGTVAAVLALMLSSRF